MEDITVNYSLFSAVREGDLAKVKEMIRTYGLSYSKSWSNGYVLLRDATEGNNTKICKLLLISGVKVNSATSLYKPTMTPLHFAVKNNNITIIEMLIDKGAKLNIKNQMGQTPLHAAVESKKLAATEILTRNSSCIHDKCNTHGYTPLHLAVEAGHFGIFELLLERGADINIKDDSGQMALHLAIERHERVMTELLVRKCNLIDDTDGRGCTALHIAAERCNSQAVELLIEKGANVNIKNENGQTALHFAVERQERAITKLLVSNCSSVDDADKNGCTALHIAAKKGNLHAVELLLQLGAKLDSMTNGMPGQGSTALHLAAENGRCEVVKFLLESGADQAQRRVDGMTVLHLAVEGGYLNIVEYLLKNGASTHSLLTFSACDSPMCLALKRKHVTISKLLLEYCVDSELRGNRGYNLLQIAAEKGDTKTVQHLLRCGASVDSSVMAEDSTTPLWLAVKNRNEEIVALLIENRANVNAEDQNGLSVLSIAVTYRDKYLIQKLLRKPLDVNTEGNKSAFREAVMKDHKNNEIVEELLQYGFTVSPEDANNRDMLFNAVCKGYTKIVGDLLMYGADPNTKVTWPGSSKMSLLHAATKSKQKDIVQLLTEHGAEVNAKDDRERAAIFYAARNLDLECINILISCGAGLIGVPEVLNAAVLKGSIETINRILKKGGEVNTKDVLGRVPLHCTTNGENDDLQAEMAKLLLDNGANVNALSTYEYHSTFTFGFSIHHPQITTADNSLGVTALYVAVSEGLVKVAETLLQYKADANYRYKSLTPLNFSVRKGNIAIIDMLLRNGAAVNAKDSDGRTALHIALGLYCEGKLPIIRMLLRNGAQINYTDNFGSTVIHIAAYSGDIKALELILKHGTRKISNSKSDLAFVKEFINEGAGTELLSLINAKDGRGRTALTLAVENDRADFAETLLKMGAEVESNTIYSEPPLHLAASQDSPEMVELLLKFGASIDYKNAYYQTALEIAVKKGCIDAANTLLEHGSDINLIISALPTLCSQSYELLTRHIIKMKVANLGLKNEHLLAIQNQDMQDFEDECLSEVARMSYIKIGNSGISFADFLKKKSNNLASCMRNDKTVETLSKQDYKSMFPIYASTIKGHFKKGRERKTLLDKVNLHLHRLFPILSYYCAQHIISFLSKEDLVNLAAAFFPKYRRHF